MATTTAPTYKLINDFLGLGQGQETDPQGVDELCLNPYWILLVLPFSEEVTFSRQHMGSYDADPSLAVRVRGQAPVVLTSTECRGLQVSTSKESPLGNLQAQLVGETNFLSLIFPGDWCLAWILQSEDQAQELLTRIRAMNWQRPCNFFQDGLKFVGRVQSLGKQLVQSPEGRRTVSYSLQAASFMEMESTVFFDPALDDSTNKRPGNFLAKLSHTVETFISKDSTIKTQDAVPFFMKVLLGSGLPPAIQAPDPQQTQIHVEWGATGQDAGVEGEDAPYAYLVPAEVGTLLGKSPLQGSPTSGTLSGFDLTEAILGVQKYQASPQGAPGTVFAPQGLTLGKDSNYSFTPAALLGAFTPNVPTFTGTPTVWTILGKYLNPQVNEMYTTLRVNRNGLVVPTLVVRQIPFTTDVFASTLESLPPRTAQTPIGPQEPNPGSNTYLQQAFASVGVLEVTRFLELPRWEVHPLMVMSYRAIRSDAMRCNFVHIYGQPVMWMKDNTPQDQIVKNPPIQDLADVKRSGLRPHMGMVSCAPADVTSLEMGFEPSLWMALISDWRMGMHLDLTGTLNVFGIQAPICVGDNVEFDGVVGHIETVLHTCQIEDGGRRAFYTTLTYSHGLRSDDPRLAPKGGFLHPDTGIYAGILDTDQRTYEPGITMDGQPSVLAPQDVGSQQQQQSPTLPPGALSGSGNSSPGGLS